MESTLSLDWRRDHDYSKVYDYLHDFQGCSLKQRLMDDLSDFLYFSKLEWAAARRVKFAPEVCLVTVSDPGTQEILDLGGTLPGDLFTDNFGKFLAALFNPPSATNNATLVDTTSVNRTTSVGSANGTTAFNALATSGTLFQIGSGTTAPARADVNIQTAFGTAPESAQFNTGNGSYSAGTMTASASITSGGTGTINEAAIIPNWDSSLGSNKPICIAHDATTATAFTAGKSITLQYSLTD